MNYVWLSEHSMTLVMYVLSIETQEDCTEAEVSILLQISYTAQAVIWDLIHLICWVQMQEDAESSGSGNEEGEDGAVDVLMKAAEPQQPKDTNNNFSAEQSQSWTQHLWDVQKFAVSAASAVGNVPQILPSLSNRIHFGKSTSWEKVTFCKLSSAYSPPHDGGYQNSEIYLLSGFVGKLIQTSLHRNSGVLLQNYMTRSSSNEVK